MIAAAPHGGDVRGVARRYGGSPSAYLDFSANINPAGPPAAVRAQLAAYARGDAVSRYPEPDLPELVGALARARGVDPRAIVVHAGSAALFDAIVRACRPRRVGVCLPAFGEYARAAAASGVELVAHALEPFADPPLDADAVVRWVRERAIDLLVLTNPHNPLGFALAADRVREIGAAVPQTILVVDEAFADYDESVSVAADAPRDPRLIVVRSLTKFYAIPDLRVGYAVLAPDRAREVRAYIPAWPVSGIAADAAVAALDDATFAEATRAANRCEREALAAGIAALGLRVLPGAANFVCFAVADAAALRERLILAHRVIVRDCTSFGGVPPNRFVRVAVRAPAENRALLDALRAETAGSP